MADFSVTLTELKTKTDTLEQYNENFKAKLAELQETEAALINMWEGDAKDAFHSAFTKDLVQMNNFHTTVGAYVTGLRNIQTNYVNAEAQNTETATTRTY